MLCTVQKCNYMVDYPSCTEMYSKFKAAHDHTVGRDLQTHFKDHVAFQHKCFLIKHFKPLNLA